MKRETINPVQWLARQGHRARKWYARRTSAGQPVSDSPVKRLSVPELKAGTLRAAGTDFLRGMTPQSLLAIFDNADLYIADQIALAAQIEETDDHINGTLDLRRQAVLRLDRLIEPGDPDDEQSVKAAEFAQEIVDAAWFHDMCDWLLRATLQQWTAIELLFAPRGTNGQTGGSSYWMPTGYRAVEPERWHFKAPDEDSDPVPGFMRTIGNHADLVEPVAGKFVIHNLAAVPGQPGRHAKVRAVGKLWFLGRLALTEWGGLIDSWFQPFSVFTYERGLSREEVQAAVNDFLELASRKVAAMPAGTTLELHDVPDQTPHMDFQRFVREGESVLLLGQVSSQMIKEGQETGATLQGEVRDDIRDADAKLLDASLNEALFAPLTAWNFGADVKPPRIKHVIHESIDPEQRGRVFKGAQEIGLPITKRQVYDELNIEEPDEKDELLVAPAAQSVPLAAKVDNVAFEKRMLELIGQGQMTREMLVNLLDVQEMIRRVGLPLYNLGKGADAEPWLPILAPAGMAEVTGEVTRDSDGDIVGGDVKEQPQLGGLGIADWGMRNADWGRRNAESEIRNPKSEIEAAAEPAKQAKEATLTGIQIEKLQTLLQAVADGTQSPEVVIQIIEEGYPGIAPEKIREMVAAALRFEPKERDAGQGVQTGGSHYGGNLSAATLMRMAHERPDAVKYVGGERFLIKPGALQTLLESSGTQTNPQSPIRNRQSGDPVAALAGIFEGYVKAARTLAETSSNADEFQAGLFKLGEKFDTDALAEAIHYATFGSYAAGRLNTAGVSASGQQTRGSQYGVFARDDELLIRKAFDEAIRMMEQRTDLLPKGEFLKLEGLNRARAWTVAWQTEQQVLEDLHGAVSRVLAEGQSFREFIDSLETIMQERGWTGLEPWHARIVYDQNVAMAYTTGRVDQARSAGVKYWRKLPSQSHEPRPEHARWDGKVFAFEQIGPPPWGFGCNCGWEVVFDEELKESEWAKSVPDFSGQQFQFDASDYFKGV